MNRTLPLALAAAAGLAGAAMSQTVAPQPFAKDTPVVIVGEISSQPKSLLFGYEGKMQVAVGPQRTDHTLHLNNARMFDETGREIAKSDLKDRWWVRAEGRVMNDPRRIDVTRLTVLGRDAQAFRVSPEYRAGVEHGYLQTVAGARQETLPGVRLFPQGTRVEVVGVISSQPRDVGVTHEKKMQVAIGPQRTDYTLHFDDARLYGLTGQEISGDDFRDRMWVRAEGEVMDDSRRIKVHRLEIIASDEGTFQRSRFFRPSDTAGYVRAL
jgi:hypothetical protein